MKDTDFEKTASLLTNDGYFDRVRELCASGLGVRQAWEQVEAELPFGLRRFTHYISFAKARREESQGTISAPTFKNDPTMV